MVAVGLPTSRTQGEDKAGPYAYTQDEGLKGKTPAEAAEMSIEGDNKWLTLVQNGEIVESQNSLKYS